MEGWIKIGRELTDDEMYRGERFDKTHAWIDLLMMANTQKRTLVKRGIRVTVQPGDVAVSIRDLAEKWMWNERTVMSFLTFLEAQRKIVIRKSNVISVLTIENFAKYQDDATQSTTQSTTQNTPQSTTQKIPINTNDAECFSSDSTTQSTTQNAPQSTTQPKSAQSIPLYKNIPSSRNYSTIPKGSKIEDSKNIMKERNVNVKKEISRTDVPPKNEHSAAAKSSPDVEPPVKGKTKRERFAMQVERSTIRGYKVFGKWLLENAPNILDGRTCTIEPPTEKEYLELWEVLSNYEISDNELKRYVLQIENNRVYLSRYKTLHLTIRNWVTTREGGQQKRIN